MKTKTKHKPTNKQAKSSLEPTKFYTVTCNATSISFAEYFSEPQIPDSAQYQLDCFVIEQLKQLYRDILWPLFRLQRTNVSNTCA